LSYNNLEYIPPEIKVFKELKYLYLNNNPLQSVPIEISECKKLRCIDLGDTLVKWLPREMAKLTFLSDINLKNCPLQGNLASTYQMGINSLMSYFQRKLDRSIYRVNYKVSSCNTIGTSGQIFKGVGLCEQHKR